MILDKIFIEAYMKWQSEYERGDFEGTKYFEGGADALIMLAQMFGYSETFIDEMLKGNSR